MATHAVHEPLPLPETDWLSEFPSENEMDSAWSQRPVAADPFDSFAREATASADVPLLRPVAELPAALIDPAIRIVDVAPATASAAVAHKVAAPAAAGARRPLIAAAVLAAAVLATALFFFAPRAITTPELPPPVVPPIAAAPSLAAPAVAPQPDAPADSTPPQLTTSPPPPVDRPNTGTTSEKAAPPTRPAAPPTPAAAATTSGTPQRELQREPPPASPPALGISATLGAPLGIGGTNAVVVAPPPALPSPPSATSRPPAAPTPPPIDLAAATVAAESAAIDVVLGGYRRAFTALDVERVAQVWPTVDRRALERAFRGLAKQAFEFHSCQVQPSGTEALASCSGRASFVPKVGGRATQVETREWQFTLSKQSGHWLITAVESKR